MNARRRAARSYTRRSPVREPYDRVLIVCEGKKTVAKVAQSVEGRTGKLVAITSWPCFKFRILLHFNYSTAPFNRAGVRSSCDRVISKLEAYLYTRKV
jgi:hypothetical protein